MDKILIFGSMPPPIGGVTIHIDRFLHLQDNNKFEIGIFDLKKMTVFRKDISLKTSRLNDIIIFFLKSKVIHIHIENNLKIVIAFISKLLRKKVIYTHHNMIISNILLWKILCFLCDRVILVNDKTIDDRLIDRKKTQVIPAFLHPYRIDELPSQIKQKINKYTTVISTNCSKYNQIYGKDIYGFDLIVDAFYILSNRGIVQNSILILVDPSNTTKEYVVNLIDGLNFGTNKILHITENIDYISIIKKSTLTIRATRVDGDSISIRESLYYNVPVIASDVTWRPPGTVVFKSNSSDDLATKVRDILLDNKSSLEYEYIDFGMKVVSIYEELTK